MKKKSTKKSMLSPRVLEFLTRCHARAMPRACGMHVRFCEFVKKIIWKKIVAIHIVFKEKTTKLNFQPA